MICDWTKRDEEFERVYSLLTEQLAKKSSVPRSYIHTIT